MNVLLQGHESPKRVELLIGLTKIQGDKMKKCVNSHLVNGMSVALVTSTYSTTPFNFNRALKAVNSSAVIVEKIKEIDCYGVRNSWLRLELVLMLTKVTSKPILQLLKKATEDGVTDYKILSLGSVTLSNFNKVLRKVDRINGIIDEIKQIDRIAMGIHI